MTTVECFLTYATYKVIDGKPIIHLFGRTKTGEQICIVDEKVEPCFYVKPAKDKEKLMKMLSRVHLSSKGTEYRVTRIEEVTQSLHNKELELVKVFVNIPAAVPHIKKEVIQWDAVDGCQEYDIRFTYKYLMTSQLTPQALISAEGEFTDKYNYKTRVLVAKKVSQDSVETYEQPRILAIDIETYNPAGTHINMEKFPILMIALYGKDFTRVLTWKQFKIKDKQLKQRVEMLENEKSMLLRCAELINEHAPDIITGYNSHGFDLPYIKKRCRKNKIHLSLGLDNSDIIIKGTTNVTADIIGISHIDVFKFIRRVVSLSMTTARFRLDDVAQELLGIGKIEVNIERLAPAWDDSVDEELEAFAKYNLRDAELTWMLLERVYPLLTEVIKIIGLSAFTVSKMSFSQLVEGYIMKKAIQINQLIPNRPSFAAVEGRSQQRYAGGFVIKPRPGFYSDVVVLDFRSIYPTILVSHNISIDTLNTTPCKSKHQAPVEGKDIYFCADKVGFLSSIMKELILYRKKIKQQIKEQGQTPTLYARSQALKYICNSFYGYLGFPRSRWYSLESAEAITAWARQYIQQLIEQAKKEGFAVVYGDTDSVFIQLGKKSKQDALNFVEAFNAQLPEFMELEIQGFYPSALFVEKKSGEGGAKKRYALLDEEGNVKITGFETVRRNTSPIAKDVQRRVLDFLLKDQDPKRAHKYVQQVIEDLRAHKIPKERVIIFTQLTRALSEYATVGPHVAAAKRMEKRGETVNARTYIYYIVCKGESKTIRDRVRLPDEVTEQDYDSEYYINNQVLPSVEKIFEALGVKKDELTSNKEQSSLGKFF